MKLVVVILFILSISLCLQTETESVSHQMMDLISTKSPKDQFKLWHYVMEKPYDLNSENAINKYKIFKSNLKKIEESNKKGLPYKLGLGPFTDMTGEEFMSLFKRKPRNQNKSRNEKKSLDNIESLNKENPEIIGRDWSDLYRSTKNQKTCGSCWAFAVIGSIEGMLTKQANKYYNLSEQTLVDCVEHKGDPCDEGNFVDKGLDYVIKNGVPLRAKYPYLGKNGKCKKFKPFVKINKYTMCNEDCSESQFIEIINQGPYASDIEVKEDLAHYREGEWDWLAGACDEANHSIVVVQYDGFRFKIRNSWGPHWGVNGYGFMKKYEKFGKLKSCGLLDYAYQPNQVNIVGK